MKTAVIALLNISIMASVLIVAVILVRAVFRKAPKSFFCFLWAVIAVRLMVPFSAGDFFRAEGSYISADTSEQRMTEERQQKNDYPPKRENSLSHSIISQNSQNSAADTVKSSADRSDKKESVQQPSAEKPEETAFEQTSALSASGNATNGTVLHWQFPDNALRILALIWLTGIAVMLGYAVISSIRVSLRVRTAVRMADNVYESEKINTPFIFGIIRPKIYLPAGITQEDKKLVLAHEQAHLHHGDHFFKPLAFVLLTVYWWNPFVWAAYSLYCRDMEAACDERVLKEDNNIKKAYSTALINCSSQQEVSAVLPLAFGETTVKARVKNILRYQKPKRGTVVICVVLALTLTAAACGVQSPVKVQEESGYHEQTLPKEEESNRQRQENSQYQQQTNAADTDIKQYLTGTHQLHSGDEEFDKVLSEIAEPTVIEQYHVKNAPFENVSYDVWRLLYEKMYEILNNGLSNEEIQQCRKEMHSAIERHPYWSQEEKKQWKERADKAVEGVFDGVGATDQTVQPQTNQDILQKVSRYDWSADEERQKQLYAFFSIFPYDLQFGSWYIPDNFIDEAPRRATLEEIVYLIYQGDNLSVPIGRYGMYNVFAEYQPKVDYGFTGSGFPGDYVLLLQGENEWIDSRYVYYKYDKKTNKVYQQLLVPDAVSMESTINLEERFPMYNQLKENEATADVTIQTPSLPSKAIQDQLVNLKSKSLEGVCKIISKNFPHLTQEQLDRFILLREATCCSRNKHLYLYNKILNPKDREQHKLSKADIHRIVDNVKKNASKLQKYIDSTDSENWYYYGIQNHNGANYYVLKDIYEIQRFPDEVINQTYIYWPDGMTRRSRTEEIVLEDYGMKVYYNRYDTSGTLVSSEELLNAYQLQFMNAVN